MKIIPDYFCTHDEARFVRDIDSELEGVREKKRDGRNRIVRFGWDYEKSDKWLGDIPEWAYGRFTWPSDFPKADSVTVNEYIKGQAISPHTDSTVFGDVAIVSLLADAVMNFVSPTGQEKVFILPRRSIAIMSGELRNSWQHYTLPLEADRRISVVYRKRL